MSAVRIWDRFKNLLDVNWGSIADGQFLKRSGVNIIGVTAAVGDVVGPASSVDSEVALFSGTGGKTIKRATGAGLVNVTSGVYQTPIDPQTLMPAGSVVDFAGSAAPTGWLLCDGSSLLRAGTFAVLFGVIGVVYGSVDGTHFNLPDLRGRVGAGKDDMGGTAANRLQTAWGVDGVTLGANGGAQSHLLTIAQMPAHNHTYTTLSGAGSQFWAAGGNAVSGAVVTGNTGGGLAHPNVQPTLVLNKIIKY